MDRRTKVVVSFLLQVFGVLRSVLSATNSDLLTANQRQLVTCVKTVLIQHFVSGESLLVSFPSNKYNFTPAKTDHLKFVEVMLQGINEETFLPVEVHRPSSQRNETSPNRRQNLSVCVIFTWPEEKESDVTFDLTLQLERVAAAGLLNNNGHFFIVVTDYVYFPGELMSSIAEKLWTKFNIFDILVLFPVLDSGGSHQDRTTRFNFYTWFPFHSSGKRHILFYECVVGGNKVRDIEKNLFPPKMPKKFQNYNKITVFTSELRPSILLTRNYTEGNRTLLEFRGPEIDILSTVLETLNITFVYSNLRHDNKPEFLTLMKKLVHGELDLIIGGLPLYELLASYGDPSVPYHFSGFRWYVPCPTPFTRLEKISKIFYPSASLTLITSFVTTAVVMWGYANFFKESESRTYKKLTDCLYNVWAVGLGVSVFRKPTTYELKAVFLLWVCYCYVMNTVYLTFFTSFLVSPGFRKQIQSYEELLTSGMHYGYSGGGHNDFRYDDLSGIITPETLSRSTICHDHEECFVRILKDYKFATLQIEFFAQYFGAVYLPRNKRLLCSLNDLFRILYIAMYLPKRSHFLTPINRVTTRAVESGLTLKWVNNMKETWKIRSGRNLSNHVFNEHFYDDGYFVFTTSHLHVAFILLALGLVLSFIALLVEILHYRKRLHTHCLRVSQLQF